jgi:Fur family zinc uptake transcriptional regulator
LPKDLTCLMNEKLAPPRINLRPDAASVARRLTEAEASCIKRGVQLTPLRREVFELLLLRGGSAKAYDLQDDMRRRRERVAPTTVYRALEFLMEQDLVHRVDATNSFVACTAQHGERFPIVLVCARCEETTEWHDESAARLIAAILRERSSGFFGTGIEVKGLCDSCRAAANHT